MDKADIELFKNLATTATGAQLVNYLKRLQNKICDSRTWGEFETRGSSTQASRHIQELIDNITLKETQVVQATNEYDS